LFVEPMAFVRSEKEQKYDRQMRLWGGHGQMALETAHICVLGSGPSASETLKNLVLPNVGEFTLVDHAKVSEADLGNNFFVTEEDVGKNRAEVVTKWLLEMNPDVKGNAVPKNPVDVISKDINFFSKFRLVIVSNLVQTSVLALAKWLRTRQIPLLVIKTYGLVASLRLEAEEIPIMESHIDEDRSDLFLTTAQQPAFPKLQEFIREFDVEDPKQAMNKHAHIPYVAILTQLGAKWAKSHGGKPPSTYDEKEAFKKEVQTFSVAWTKVAWQQEVAKEKDAKRKADLEAQGAPGLE